MNSTYAQRLQESMEAKQPPADRKALAEAMGITVQALGNILRGEVRKINYTQAARAAKFLNVELEWLTGDEFKAKDRGSLLLAEPDGSILLPEPPSRFVDYRAVRMTVLDYNRLIFQFRKGLPANLREYAGAEVMGPSKDRKVYLDYYSPTAGAMVIPVLGSTIGKPILEAVLELVMLRHSDEVGRVLMLLFIAPLGREYATLDKTAADACQMWGIQVETFNDPTGAAQFIASIEDDIRQSMSQT